MWQWVTKITSLKSSEINTTFFSMASESNGCAYMHKMKRTQIMNTEMHSVCYNSTITGTFQMSARDSEFNTQIGTGKACIN